MKNKILAVDDEMHIAQLVKITLELAGYVVSIASNGVEALEKVAHEKPDLMILDVMMPRMNGFEVLRRLKGDPATEDIPIIMLTVRTADTDTFEAWHRGIDTYISKPFDPRELLSFVSRFLPLKESSSDEEQNPGRR